MAKKLAKSSYKPSNNRKRKKTPLEEAAESQKGRVVRERFLCAKCCRTFSSGYSYMAGEKEYIICRNCRAKLIDEPSGSVRVIYTAMRNG